MGRLLNNDSERKAPNVRYYIEIFWRNIRKPFNISVKKSGFDVEHETGVVTPGY
jgi:hypothetical protein